MTADARADKLVEYHSGPLGGHNDISITKAKISNDYFWPGMSADIADMLSL